MNQIEETIKEIHESLKDFRAHYSSNEQAVRAQLIEPVLNSLGWKTRNPRFVRPNAPNEEGKIPDYTLFKDNKSILVVEAKNISIELNDNKVINQIANYCYKPGIDFGILTNGIKWLLFKTFEKNPQDRIIWEIDLEKETIENVVRKLNSFSFENIDKLERLIHTSKVFETNWNELVKSSENIVSIVTQKFIEKLKKTDLTLKLDINEVKSFVEDKLSEYLELIPNNENDYLNETLKSNFEPEFSEVKENIFNGNIQKKEREKISVLFPDGTNIYESKPTETFIKVITKIGPQFIQPLNISHCGVPLVSSTKDKKYYQHKEGKVYYMTQASTQKKYEILNEINKKLSLGLKIEKFLPEIK